jgi:hypothetical protein
VSHYDLCWSVELAVWSVGLAGGEMGNPRGFVPLLINGPQGGLGPEELRGLGDCLVFADHSPAPYGTGLPGVSRGRGPAQPCLSGSVVLADSHLTSPM